MQTKVLHYAKKLGLEPYVYKAAASGSVYIKFNSRIPIGSLRIGDHEGRRKYTYKWNLRSDRVSYLEIMDRGVLRRYYPAQLWKEMVEEMVRQTNPKYLKRKLR